jgi:hypothetical protein
MRAIASARGFAPGSADARGGCGRTDRRRGGAIARSDPGDGQPKPEGRDGLPGYGIGRQAAHLPEEGAARRPAG